CTAGSRRSLLPGKRGRLRAVTPLTCGPAHPYPRPAVRFLPPTALGLALALLGAPAWAQGPAPPPSASSGPARSAPPEAPGKDRDDVARARILTFAPPRMLSVELHFELGPGAKRCPGEERLHVALAKRLGYDPLDPAAKGPRAGQLDVKIVGKSG